MTESTIWWVLAGSVVAVELVTGTVYMLLLSVGLAAGALAAHAGASTSVQILVAAVFGSGSVIGWRSYRKSRSSRLAGDVDQALNLDIGEIVQIDDWKSDGTSSVKYRGANWRVSLPPGETAATGPHRITEVIGNRLIVKKI